MLSQVKCDTLFYYSRSVYILKMKYLILLSVGISLAGMNAFSADEVAPTTTVDQMNEPAHVEKNESAQEKVESTQVEKNEAIKKQDLGPAEVSKPIQIEKTQPSVIDKKQVHADEVMPIEPQNRAYITPLIGFAAPTTNASGGPYFSFGGEMGVHSGIGDIGIFASSLSNSTTISGVPVSANITFLMMSLTGQYDIFYYGGRFGIGMRSISTTVSGTTYSASGSSFAVSPVVGIRVPIANNISFSLETSWQVISSGEISGTLGSVSLTSVGYLVPLAGVRLGF